MQQHKVIFHIDELDKWELLLKDVSILIDVYSDDDFHIDVLATSEAVKFYNSKEISYTHMDFMEYLEKKGVNFTAGKNDLINYKVNEDDLIHFVNIVPVTTLELINKQGDGYIYLKAW
jgi:intracellular sulfur oxidation DsrE/DsrF family protein